MSWFRDPGRSLPDLLALHRGGACSEWTNARLGKQQRVRGIICRPSLPRNANGKVLKRELRQELAELVY
jgi:acyl-coenzyme A synthetase/AMP-(fatty) acid ligase